MSYFFLYEVEDDGKARLITSKQLTSRRRPLRDLTLDDTGHVAFAVSDEKGDISGAALIRFPDLFRSSELTGVHWIRPESFSKFSEAPGVTIGLMIAFQSFEMPQRKVISLLSIRFRFGSYACVSRTDIFAIARSDLDTNVRRHLAPKMYNFERLFHSLSTLLTDH
ncbi:hypothetical protein ACTXT7_010385 [Hymenolepis weldensis]